MSQTTDGNNESVKSRLAQFDRTLDAFEEKTGLSATCPLEVENKAKELLAITPVELSRLDPVECAEGSYSLIQFAIYLQKAMNRETARVTMAERNIKHVIAPFLSQQRGSSFEERKLLAIRENDAAMSLEKVVIDAQTRLDRLNYLSNKVEALAKSLTNLGYAKRGNKNESY